MLICGRNSVREALRSGSDLKIIYISDAIKSNENVDLFNAIKKSGVRYQILPKTKMDKMTQAKHQGFIAQMPNYNYADAYDVLNESLNSSKQCFFVLLDGIEDPHNLGSIIRTCECAGVTCVVIEEHSSCKVNETVIRTSAGAANHMPVAIVKNLNAFIDDIKKRGVWVYACEADGQNIYSSRLTGDLALVIGSEGKGVGRLTKQKCDGIISLPMNGKVNSLNASNAAAIAIYEAVRQRKMN